MTPPYEAISVDYYNSTTCVYQHSAQPTTSPLQVEYCGRSKLVPLPPLSKRWMEILESTRYPMGSFDSLRRDNLHHRAEALWVIIFGLSPKTVHGNILILLMQLTQKHSF